MVFFQDRPSLSAIFSFLAFNTRVRIIPSLLPDYFRWDGVTKRFVNTNVSCKYFRLLPSIKNCTFPTWGRCIKERKPNQSSVLLDLPRLSDWFEIPLRSSRRWCRPSPLEREVVFLVELSRANYATLGLRLGQWWPLGGALRLPANPQSFRFATRFNL